MTLIIIINLIICIIFVIIIQVLLTIIKHDNNKYKTFLSEIPGIG